jgi:ubiquinone biosynthesis protein UbiJ
MLNSLAASLGATLEASLWPGLAERAVLMLNHLLRAQDAAAQRLTRHAGQSIRIDWRSDDARWPKPPALRLVVTPAGLFEVPEASTAEQAEHLRIDVDLPAPLDLPRMLAEGRRPSTRIEGDTELAADLAWLSEHLRWDAEHDLARVLGDLPARTLVTAGRAVLAGLRGFVARARPGKEGEAGASAAPPR